MARILAPKHDYRTSKALMIEAYVPPNDTHCPPVSASIFIEPGMYTVIYLEDPEDPDIIVEFHDYWMRYLCKRLHRPTIYFRASWLDVHHQDDD